MMHLKYINVLVTAQKTQNLKIDFLKNPQAPDFDFSDSEPQVWIVFCPKRWARVYFFCPKLSSPPLCHLSPATIGLVLRLGCCCNWGWVEQWRRYKGWASGRQGGASERARAEARMRWGLGQGPATRMDIKIDKSQNGPDIQNLPDSIGCYLSTNKFTYF